ncbi:MAG TPA: EAL domain-containing protein [Rudaea sp.]|nr:EAL domain-containing protein [Rudaea sp.]
MSFRVRLVSFLVASLAILQIVMGVLVYEVTRRELIGQGEQQLVGAGRAFARQLDDVAQRVADNVQVLTLDFALRSAIAQRDRDTVLSALRNHGNRVGATRMLLVGLDGSIEADTAEGAPPLAKFPYDDLTGAAFEKPAAAVVAWDGHAYWMVVVPVSAPALIGLIAAAIPVDDAFLAHLQEQSTLPTSIELAAQGSDGQWRVLAHGRDPIALAQPLIAARGLPPAPELFRVGGREYVAMAMSLNSSKASAPIEAVLGYSLDDALRPYRSVGTAWAILLALGLVFGMIAALVIARGVSRPVEALAAMARRIGAGDYSEPPPLARRGEIGELADTLAGMARAIAEREERIRFQSGHDAITGLPNRVTAETAIQQELGARGRPAGALLMVGLGRLPEIVKTLGHAISDRLMRDAGGRIRKPADAALVARATDTEFLVWLRDARQPEAIALAFRILDALAEPYREADLAIDVAPAVGVALHPAHGMEASALLQRAEVALFAALGSEEPVVVYDPTADPHRPERLSLMGDLREALEHDRLELHYQPKLNLATRRIDGAEGLARWVHPRAGAIAPDAFIPLAEETGNMRRLTRWVLAAGIARAQAWAAAGLAVRLALNLSARDLDDAELPARVGELLAAHGVAPERILLEITESSVMGKPEAAVRVLRRLADQGIDLAIDDFGVGQSSFSYLRRLPVRELKIDKSFLLKLAEGAQDRAIVSSIVELGHRLGYRVTAEGVTDQATLDYLGEIGCDHAQGFFIARPMPAEAFDAFLAHSEQQ